MLHIVWDFYFPCHTVICGRNNKWCSDDVIVFQVRQQQHVDVNIEIDHLTNVLCSVRCNICIIITYDCPVCTTTKALVCV